MLPQWTDKRTYTMCEDLTCYFFPRLFIFFKWSCSFIAKFWLHSGSYTYTIDKVKAWVIILLFFQALRSPLPITQVKNEYKVMVKLYPIGEKLSALRTPCHSATWLRICNACTTYAAYPGLYSAKPETNHVSQGMGFLNTNRSKFSSLWVSKTNWSKFWLKIKYKYNYNTGNIKICKYSL